MSGEPKSISDILDNLDEAASEHAKISIGDMVASFGNRSYGPFLIVPALVELSPIGGIPGIPTLLAAIVFLFAIQMAFGRHHFWLPAFLAKRSVSSRRLKSATEKLSAVAHWVDTWFHARLPGLTRGRFVRPAAITCALLALTVPPLELIPFASSAPMSAIAMFGLALLVHDGLLMIVAMAIAIAVVALGLSFLW